MGLNGKIYVLKMECKIKVWFRCFVSVADATTYGESRVFWQGGT
jgi:hypothetical protein